MPVERLNLIACVGAPDFASLVAARRDDLIALRIKLNLTDLVLVALQQRDAGTSENVIDAR